MRDMTAAVATIPLITGSSLSKKVTEGIAALVMAVKCGRGAFMKDRASARRLAESRVVNGRANGVATEAHITAMDQPLGRAVGNSLEVIESIETLKGRGPADVATLSIQLAARMVKLGMRADTLEAAEAKVTLALASGRALEVFRRMVE